MPSSRQFRTLGFIALLAIAILYYVNYGASNTQHSVFYTRTRAAIDRKKTALERDRVVAEEKDRAERVERVRKEHDKAVADDEAEQLTSSESKAKAKVGAVEPAYTEVIAGGEKRADEEAARKKRKEEEVIETELNAILRKGPIIIFSKSYCPYSKKAKHILLDLYEITPKPYVVELDVHELGPGLQSHLGKSTGRRTVPNVLVNGKSIGGGDDIEALHESGKLAETLKNMGGKRIVGVDRKKD
ncbi:hypothetical protein CERZMDRAFT_46589 [Cercospora zeae-maydis SCOH1-5]|uniref:Glutaredoxin domain-containing protein n=1 Tax=Cercospora zeae-maydis SCOH1-5 TaxID=717836 RepID=A0A6A6F8U2_9PEZI|nr:hypothetical protein CERZMDRAFT_46589 [Cercospora zeae-maydis SCOH1-5]